VCQRLCSAEQPSLLIGAILELATVGAPIRPNADCRGATDHSFADPRAEDRYV